MIGVNFDGVKKVLCQNMMHRHNILVYIIISVLEVNESDDASDIMINVQRIL